MLDRGESDGRKILKLNDSPGDGALLSIQYVMKRLVRIICDGTVCSGSSSPSQPHMSPD